MVVVRGGNCPVHCSKSVNVNKRFGEYLLVISFEGYVSNGDVLVPAGRAADPVVGERVSGAVVQREPALHRDVIALTRVVLLVL